MEGDPQCSANRQLRQDGQPDIHYNIKYGQTRHKNINNSHSRNVGSIGSIFCDSNTYP